MKITHNSRFEQHVNNENTCLLCGKDIKNEIRFWVEIDIVTGAVWSQAEGECPTSQGFFAIGSNCAKKFEAGVLEVN